MPPPPPSNSTDNLKKQLCDNKKEIKEIIQKRDIPFLVHFTNSHNLEDIFKSGIIPRNNLIKENKEFCFNDDLRLDGYTNATCISVSFPNYKMFYKYRMLDKNSNWVVLLLKPSLLLEKESLFLTTNAANKHSISLLRNEPNKLKTAQAFDEMFARDVFSQISIGNHHPTDPQAEILIPAIIEPKFIAGLVFEEHFEVTSSFQKQCKDMNIGVYNDNRFFTYRKVIDKLTINIPNIEYV